jgi:hypothetical protein
VEGLVRVNTGVTRQSRQRIVLLWKRAIAGGTPLRATTVRKRKAGSCEPKRCHAVPPQRAIEMYKLPGNSKSPTALRL